MYKQLLLLSAIVSCSLAANPSDYISGQTDLKSKTAKQERKPGLFAGSRKIVSAWLDLCWRDRGKVSKAICATAVAAFFINEARLYKNNEFGYCFLTNWFLNKYKPAEHRAAFERYIQAECNAYYTANPQQTSQDDCSTHAHEQPPSRTFSRNSNLAADRSRTTTRGSDAQGHAPAPGLGLGGGVWGQGQGQGLGFGACSPRSRSENPNPSVTCW